MLFIYCIYCILRTFAHPLQHIFCRRYSYEWCCFSHLCYRHLGGSLSVLRQVAGQDVGHRSQRPDAGSSPGRRSGLYAVFEIHGFCQSVLVHYRCRPCHGSDYRRRVRLAAGLLMAYDRRRLLRRCPGLCRSLCVHEEWRQIYGRPHRKVYRHDGPPPVPALLLGLQPAGHRRFRRYRRYDVQRLRQGWFHGPAQCRCRFHFHVVHLRRHRFWPVHQEVQPQRKSPLRHRYRPLDRHALRRHRPADLSGPHDLAVHHLRLHLLCVHHAHVALETAA